MGESSGAMQPRGPSSRVPFTMAGTGGEGKGRLFLLAPTMVVSTRLMGRGAGAALWWFQGPAWGQRVNRGRPVAEDVEKVQEARAVEEVQDVREARAVGEVRVVRRVGK